MAFGALAGGGKGGKKNTTPIETRLRIQTAVMGMARTKGWGRARQSGQLIWYGDFKHITQSQGGKGGFGGGKGGGSVTTYSASVQLALCDGPITSVNRMWDNQTSKALSALGFTAFLGSRTQSAWSYLSSKHSGQALNYRGLAHVDAANLDLGQSATLGNYTFEVTYERHNAITAFPDADPKDIVTDVCSDQFDGMGLDATNDIGDLTVFSQYAKAATLLFSPVVSTQQSASSFLAQIVEAANSEAFISQGKLQITPYAEHDVSAHGASYVAPTNPVYDLSDDDFLPLQENGSLPSGSAATLAGTIHCVRIDSTKLKNFITIGYLNRNADYNPDAYTAIDDASVAMLGEQKDSKTDYTFICDPGIANICATLKLQRQQVRAYYAFTIGRKYIRLDPMDIVTLTVANTSLNRKWVRIKEITENDDGTLTMIAEEYLEAKNAPPLYDSETSGADLPNLDVAPPATNTPLVFQVPFALSQELALGVAASGEDGWAGAHVWLSTDNETYVPVGEITGPCKMGVLTAALGANADPDTTHTLSVDLTESSGFLPSGTQTDADYGRTLCLVDGEFLSFETATLTSGYSYDLTYLRRGLYQTAIAAHSIGGRFLYLGPSGGGVNSNICVIPYSKDQIGQTVYLKITPYNYWKGGELTLDEVGEISFTVPAPTGPEVVDITTIAAKPRTNQDGSVTAGVTATIPVPTDPTITGVQWQWRIAGDDTTLEIGAVNPVVGATHDIYNVPPGSSVEFAYRLITDITQSEWSAWKAVTTPDVVLPIGSVDALSFGDGLAPVEILAALPSSGNFQGRQVRLTTNNKLYTWTSAAVTTGTAYWSNALDGADLTAFTVLPSKIYIGDVSNLILNTDFGDAGYWTIAGTDGPPTINTTDTAVTATLGEVAAVKFASNGHNPQGTSYALTPAIAVEGGKTYRLSYKSLVKAGFNGRANFYIDWRKADGSHDSYSNNYGVDYRTAAAGSDTQATQDIQIAAPADAVTAILNFTVNWPAAAASAGSCYLARPRFNLATDASLLINGAVQANHMAANSVTTGALASGSVVADKLGANSVTASKMAIDGANIVGNSNFAPGGTQSADGWIGTGFTFTAAASPGTSPPLPNCGVQTARDAYFGDEYFTVTPGETYFVSMWVYGNTNGNTVGIGLNFLNTSGTNSWTSCTQLAPNTSGWQQVSGQITVPANVYRARVWTQIAATSNFGTLYFTGVVCRKAASGELLVNGTIKGVHIQGQTITGDKVAAHTLTASTLYLGDMSNMLLNTDFSDTAYWGLGGGATVNTADTTILAALNATAMIKSALGNGTTSQTTSVATVAYNKTPVEPGKFYRFAAAAWAKTGYTGLISIRVIWYTNAGAIIGASNFITVAGSDCRAAAAASDLTLALEGQLQAPATAAFCEFDCYMPWSNTLANAQYAYMAQPRMNRALTAEMFVDGEIDAVKLNVAELSAISANIGVVTAGILQSAGGGTKLDLDNATLIFDNGSVMSVMGDGFGSSNQFIEWVGPHLASLSSCTESNGVRWVKTDGSAYFGGTLNVGAASTPGRTTANAAVGITAETPDFSYAGHTLTISNNITLSNAFGGTYTTLANYHSACDALGLSYTLNTQTGTTGNATVKLARSLADAAYVDKQTFVVPVTWSATKEYDGESWTITMTWNGSYSSNWTDDDSTVDTRKYKLYYSALDTGIAGMSSTLNLVCVEST